MQSPVYPYNAYPYDATVRSKQHTGQIIIGAFLGSLPLLVMWTFAFLSGASSVFTYDVIIYSFPCTSLVVLLIAVPFLFFKEKRWIALALAAAWVSTVPMTLASAILFAI